MGGAKWGSSLDLLLRDGVWVGGVKWGSSLDVYMLRGGVGKGLGDKWEVELYVDLTW